MGSIYVGRMRLVVFILAAVAISTYVANAQTDRPPSTGIKLMTGVLKAVSAASLTLEIGGNEVIFDVTPSTRVVAKGMASDLVLRWPRSIANVVKRGDRVTVRYRVVNSAMRAIEVRVQKDGA
jgi:hypothetical protein